MCALVGQVDGCGRSEIVNAQITNLSDGLFSGGVCNHLGDGETTKSWFWLKLNHIVAVAKNDRLSVHAGISVANAGFLASGGYGPLWQALCGVKCRHVFFIVHFCIHCIRIS
jgi:hypothetical protein